MTQPSVEPFLFRRYNGSQREYPIPSVPVLRESGLRRPRGSSGGTASWFRRLIQQVHQVVSATRSGGILARLGHSTTAPRTPEGSMTALPPSSHAPSLEIHFEQPDHTTGSTSVTGSQSTPAPSSLHQPNRLVGNRVDIAIRVEEWRRSVPREWYHPYRHINQVNRQRRVHWPRHDLERNEGEYLRPQERRNYKY